MTNEQTARLRELLGAAAIAGLEAVTKGSPHAKA